MRPHSGLRTGTACFRLILLLLPAALGCIPSDAVAQALCTNDSTQVVSGINVRQLYTYYCASGVPHGAYKQWKNGTLVASLIYVEGVLEGPYRQF